MQSPIVKYSGPIAIAIELLERKAQLEQANFQFDVTLSNMTHGLCMFDAAQRLIVCNKRYHKKTTLQELDAELDLLRAQVRLAQQLGWLDFRKYEHWATLLDEVGRMIGGWIKSMAEPAAGDAR